MIIIQNTKWSWQKNSNYPLRLIPGKNDQRILIWTTLWCFLTADYNDNSRYNDFLVLLRWLGHFFVAGIVAPLNWTWPTLKFITEKKKILETLYYRGFKISKLNLTFSRRVKLYHAFTRKFCWILSKIYVNYKIIFYKKLIVMVWLL